jgi:hypothetical protein
MKTNFFTAFRIWILAQMIYLIINLMCLPLYHSMPWIIFLYAELLGIGLGIPALIAFGLCFHALASNCDSNIACISAIALAGLLITFTATLLAAFLIDGNAIWQIWVQNIAFPLFGIFSAALSMFFNRKRIMKVIRLPAHP